MSTKKKNLKRNKKTKRRYKKIKNIKNIKNIKRNNIRIKIKNLGRTKRKYNKIHYGCSIKNMKGGDATLNPITSVTDYTGNYIESVNRTFNGEAMNNIYTNYNDYP
tara:strand:- start:527 stop:844 length:318 start_codon:yes stop_codon:yes gene_type:complete